MDDVPTWDRIRFPVTRRTWLIALGVIADDRTPEARADALADLFRSYWPALYALAMRTRSHEDAEDVVQGFISSLLRPGALARYRVDRSRFRCYVCGAFRNYERNEARGRKSRRRRLDLILLSPDIIAGIEQRAGLYSSPPDPERLFDREWALALIGLAMEDTRKSYHDRGAGPEYDYLVRYLEGDVTEESHAEAAARLGATVAAVKMKIKRLRERFTRSLRERVAETLGEDSEIDDELRWLRQALTR